MNIAMINCGLVGSTGKIMLQVAQRAKENGDNVCFAVSGLPGNIAVKTEFPTFIIGNEPTRKLNVLLGRLTGYNGFFAYFATKSLLKQLDKFNPDLIHLHNLHESYINLPLLFSYIKKKDIRVVWTLHDCWAFTGRCSHFQKTMCEKWKTGCHHCPQLKTYPKSYIDTTKSTYSLKKKLFTGVKDLTVVTPSKWLSELVEQSYLKEYNTVVINNGIDLSVFKPTNSDFRKNHNIPEYKFVILGVAFGWNYDKGLDIFLELEKKLDSSLFQIVLVGTDEAVEKTLPQSIISIRRTNNQQELAEIYSSADIFVNPTRQDNYPTVNMEAIACGTPVLTFNTGGSPEIPDDSCGLTVKENTLSETLDSIMNLYQKNISKEICLIRAKNFDKEVKFEEYIKLFESMF